MNKIKQALEKFLWKITRAERIVRELKSSDDELNASIMRYNSEMEALIKSSSDEMQTFIRNSWKNIHQVLICNQLAMHSALLCEEFSGFIDDLLKVARTRNINIVEIKNSVYYKFLLKQNEIEKVCSVLDESSRKTWYYLMLIRICNSFFSDNPNRSRYLSAPDKHYVFLKMIQNITGYGGGIYDLDNVKFANNKKIQYIYDDDFLQSGMFVIDAGAFDGDTGAMFSNIVGNGGYVYCFEPTASSFERLKERKLANVQCVNKGLYSRECELKFRVDENDPVANTLVQKWVSKAKDVVTIPVTTIDKFVEENNIPRIDYIKMDIEGSELEALKGGRETIEKSKPNMAICIYHNQGDDLIDIPIWMVSNYADIYDFSIKHHAKGWSDTVLYARKKTAV